jgi:hypothetical protein
MIRVFVRPRCCEAAWSPHSGLLRFWAKAENLILILSSEQIGGKDAAKTNDHGNGPRCRFNDAPGRGRWLARESPRLAIRASDAARRAVDAGAAPRPNATLLKSRRAIRHIERKAPYAFVLAGKTILG